MFESVIVLFSPGVHFFVSLHGPPTEQVCTEYASIGPFGFTGFSHLTYALVDVSNMLETFTIGPGSKAKKRC